MICDIGVGSYFTKKVLALMVCDNRDNRDNHVRRGCDNGYDNGYDNRVVSIIRYP